jgi:hypothetical protein
MPAWSNRYQVWQGQTICRCSTRRSKLHAYPFDVAGFNLAQHGKQFVRGDLGDRAVFLSNVQASNHGPFLSVTAHNPSFSVLANHSSATERKVIAAAI